MFTICFLHNVSALSGAIMMTIRGGSDVIIYGGKLAAATSAVWKYSLIKDSWTKVGDLNIARCQQGVIAVKDMECP